MEAKKPETARIDKYLWAVRIYKTRSQAAEACRKGRVIMDEVPVKPSRLVKPGDHMLVKKLPVTYSYTVLQVVERRLPAREVAFFCENKTPRQELDKLKKDHVTLAFKRERGTGRPTKKERRLMDRLRGDN
jgi:ribosome-associated heat shock protein Hsp15